MHKLTKGLVPQKLKRIAYEYMLEHPNATCTAFTNHLISKDLTFALTTKTKEKDRDSQLESLEDKIKELTIMMKKGNEINSINTAPQYSERNPGTQYNRQNNYQDQGNNPRFKQNGTRFCKECKRNGHTVAFCHQKKRKDEMNRQSRDVPKQRTFTNDYKIDRTSDFRNRSFSRDRPQYDRSRSFSRNNTSNSNTDSRYRRPTPQRPDYRERQRSDSRRGDSDRSFHDNPRFDRSFRDKPGFNRPFRDRSRDSSRYSQSNNRESRDSSRYSQSNNRDHSRHEIRFKTESRENSPKRFTPNYPSNVEFIEDGYTSVADVNVLDEELNTSESSSVRPKEIKLNECLVYPYTTHVPESGADRRMYNKFLRNQKMCDLLKFLETETVPLGGILVYPDINHNRFIYLLGTQSFRDNPRITDHTPNLRSALDELKRHMVTNNITRLSFADRTHAGKYSQRELEKLIKHTFQEVDYVKHQIIICDDPLFCGHCEYEDDWRGVEWCINTINVPPPDYIENDQQKDKLQIHTILNNENFIHEMIGDLLEQSGHLAHCISEDAKMSAGIAVQFKQRFPQMLDYIKENQTGIGSAIPFYDVKHHRIIYNLVVKERFFDKPTLIDIEYALWDMRQHAVRNNVYEICIPQIACGLDGHKWEDIYKILYKIFRYGNIQVIVYTHIQTDPHDDGLPKSNIKCPDSLNVIMDRYIPIVFLTKGSPPNKREHIAYFSSTDLNGQWCDLAYAHALCAGDNPESIKEKYYENNPRLFVGDAKTFYDKDKKRYSYALIVANHFSEKDTSWKIPMQHVYWAVESMREHAMRRGIDRIAIQRTKTVFGLDWKKVRRALIEKLQHYQIQIVIYCNTEQEYEQEIVEAQEAAKDCDQKMSIDHLSSDEEEIDRYIDEYHPDEEVDTMSCLPLNY